MKFWLKRMLFCGPALLLGVIVMLLAILMENTPAAVLGSTVYLAATYVYIHDDWRWLK